MISTTSDFITQTSPWVFGSALVDPRPATTTR